MKVKVKPLVIKMTEDEVRELSNESMGVCLACGEYRDCCEPDARAYPCESCDQPMVYGVEEALLMGRVSIVRG